MEAYGVSPEVRISAGGGGNGSVGSIGSSSGGFFNLGGSNGSSSLSDDGDFDSNSSSDPSMPYIPAHLDYCLYELLKNAARATVESAKIKSSKRKAAGAGAHRTLSLSARGTTMPSFSSSAFLGPLPPIVVRICDAPGRAATLRISDQGGGIPEEQQEAVWRYGFTTAGAAGGGEEANGGGGGVGAASSSSPKSPNSSSSSATMMMDAMMSEGGGNDSILPNPSTSPSSRWRMGGLGFGLPLSRLYARYFGGDLKLISMPGYGVDAFLTLERLAGDWVEPADEHVPVRPSAVPKRGGKEGGSGSGESGSGGGESGEKKGEDSATAAAAASVSSSASSSANRGRRRAPVGVEHLPGAALP